MILFVAKMAKKNWAKLIVLFILLQVWQQQYCSADEQLFGYLQGVETMPKGKWQVYEWFTQRSGKAEGLYSAQDHQFEIEVGITNRLQLSLYTMFSGHQIQGASATKGGTKMEDRNTILEFNGLKAAFKYMLVSPYLNDWGIGAALYVEPAFKFINPTTGLRQEKYALEIKLLLQKNWLNDRLIGVANFILEPERAVTYAGLRDELNFKFLLGLTYLVAPNWYVGFEYRLDTQNPALAAVRDWSMVGALGNFSYVAMFVGPTIHYTSKKWWVTLTAMPQFFGMNLSKNPILQEIPWLNLDKRTAFEIRLKISYNF
jgi:hypothetical protein